MQTRVSLVATLIAAAGMSSLGFCSMAFGAAHAEGLSAAPPSSAVPPTCTCPPQPTAAPVPVTTALGAASSTAPAAAAPSTVAGAPPTSSVGPVAGAAVPANATLEQLQLGIEPIFGPTTDALAEFAIFGVAPPQGIPTPAGAEIEEFQFSLDSLASADQARYFGTIVVTSTMAAADLVTMYQSALPAAGFTQTGDSVDVTSSGAQIRWLEYELPSSDYTLPDLAVGIIDADVDYVQIEWSGAVDPALGAMFSAWTGLPLVGDAQLIENARIGNYISGDRVVVETGYRVGLEYAQLESQFLAGLTGTPYTVDAEASEPGRWAELTAAPFSDFTVHFSEGYVEGTSALNVSASYAR